jgi:hypothetical protein
MIKKRTKAEDYDDEIVKDGESVGVSVMMMDSMQRAVARGGAARDGYPAPSRRARSSGLAPTVVGWLRSISAPSVS